MTQGLLEGLLQTYLRAIILLLLYTAAHGRKVKSNNTVLGGPLARVTT